ARFQLTRLGVEVADGVLLPPLVERRIGDDVVLEPTDAVVRRGELLVRAMGEPRGPGEEGVRLARAPLRVHDRRRAPLPARDVRRRVGRQVLRVDRDLGAAPLQEAGSGEPDGAAAEDGEALLARLPGLVDRQLGGAPGERDPASTVAVVVDDSLVAHLLDLEAEA